MDAVKWSGIGQVVGLGFVQRAVQNHSVFTSKAMEYSPDPTSENQQV
jgi:hypothetical protein